MGKKSRYISYANSINNSKGKTYIKNKTKESIKNRIQKMKDKTKKR